MNAAIHFSAVYRLIEAHRVVQTVEGARELGVFHRLAEGPASASTLAEGSGIAPERFARLLDALVALELVGQEDDAYRLRVPLALPEKMLPLRDIPGALRGKRDFEGHTSKGAAQSYPEVVAALSAVSAVPAALAAERMAAEGLRVLEVGGGACSWSLALAARCPDARVTVNDLPPVLEQSRLAVDRAGLTDRYDWLPGDVFTLDLPERQFDRVLVPMVLHLFGEVRSRTLLHRAARAVAPGGQLVVIDAFDPGNGPNAGTALYSLELLTRTADGRVHDQRAVCTWLEEAGLVDAGLELLPTDPPLGLLSARRPEA